MYLSKRFALPSRRALTTGLLATSLALNLSPSQVAHAQPSHIVQPVGGTHESPLTTAQQHQIQRFGRLIIASIQSFGNQINPPKPDPPAQSGPSDALYAAWTKVAVCEEGGWVGSSGSEFPNSLGIRSSNWYAYGGGSDVSPAAQIEVAQKMVNDLGIDIPDQNGCQPGGW